MSSRLLALYSPIFLAIQLLVYWYSSPLSLLSSDLSCHMGFLLFFYSFVSLTSRVILLASLFDQHFGPLKYPPSVSQSVSLSVRQKFSYFPPSVFSDFLQQVSLFQMYKSDEARFLKKKCVSKLFSILSPK